MIELLQGDCLAVMAGMDAGSVDAVVTDPPYGLNYPYASYNDTRGNLRALIDASMPHVLRVGPRAIILPGITQINLYPDPTWIGCVAWNTTGSFGKYGFTQWMPILLYGKDLAGWGGSSLCGWHHEYYRRHTYRRWLRTGRAQWHGPRR